MSVVNHNNDEDLDYKYLACPSSLNLMTKLIKKNKEPGTIKDT